MRLKTRQKFCSCGGMIAQHKNRLSRVTIYTATGPFEAEHLEYRCKQCGKGYFYGYSTDSVDKEDETKQLYKLYDEDCLECEVSS